MPDQGHGQDQAVPTPVQGNAQRVQQGFEPRGFVLRQRPWPFGQRVERGLQSVCLNGRFQRYHAKGRQAVGLRQAQSGRREQQYVGLYHKPEGAGAPGEGDAIHAGHDRVHQRQSGLQRL